MKLKATFATRRDGSYGRVGTLNIEADGTVEVSDADEAQRLIRTGNFEPADKKSTKPADNTGMVITNGDEQIDLAVTSHADLLELAQEIGLEVRGNASAKSLREAIFAAAQPD